MNRKSFIQIILIALVFFLTSAISYWFGKMSEHETRQYETRKEVLKTLLSEAAPFSDYLTVDWERYRNEYRPYPCDWPDKYNLYTQVNDGKFSRVFCPMWVELQNAKKDFVKKTTEARIVSSQKVYDNIKLMEAGFDEVFLAVIKDYYSRSFIDNYDEIMKEKFFTLEKALREDISR